MQKPKQLPTKSGIYIFKDAAQKPLYIGKAGNLKQRLASYWRRDAPSKAQQLVREARTLLAQETESEIEALILEARLIKHHRPKYNVLMRDDKNYFFVGFTREEFPRVFITHQPNAKGMRNKELGIMDKKRRNSKFIIHNSVHIGPFTGGGALKITLRLLRRIFPHCTCGVPHKRPCLNAQIGRCPGYCCDKRQTLNDKRQKEYANNIRNLIAVLRGKKQRILAELKKQMPEAARKQEYEQAARLRDQIAGLKNIFAHKSVLELPRARTSWKTTEQKLKNLVKVNRPIQRIEGYDISNLSGTEATGSMVVFTNGKPNKKEYRMFRIKSVRGANDPAMIREVIKRRLRHKEWLIPDLIVIDGGKSQFNAALLQLKTYDLQPTTRLTALAKKEEELYTESRRMPIPLKTLNRDILHLFQAVRDEAHRFAKKYHHTLRKKSYENAAYLKNKN